MAFKIKSLIFLLAALLSVSLATVSFPNEEFKNKAIYSKTVAPAPAPSVKAPTPTPPVAKAPTTPTSPVAKPPTTPAPPVANPPAPAPPVAKPPAPLPPVKPPTGAPLPPVRSKADCIPLCAERCKLHSRKNICNRACITCCDRCKCVPPGTYGNREKCGTCYTGMTTRNKKPKCP